MSGAYNEAGLIPVKDQDANKLKSTVIANAALAGLAVYERPDGSFAVSSWGFIKPVADLAAVVRMTQQIGGAA